MREVAKERFSKRVVPEILYEATAVRVCIGLPQADLGSAGITLEQEWPDGMVPGQVDQFLVRKCRITESYLRRRHCDHQHQNGDRRASALWSHRISFGDSSSIARRRPALFLGAYFHVEYR